MTGFYEVIKLNYDRLNDTEKEMCSYLADHLEELADLSINDMAKMLQSSRSSVLRMAQKLGYRGYSEMKYEMKLLPKRRKWFLPIWKNSFEKMSAAPLICWNRLTSCRCCRPWNRRII